MILWERWTQLACNTTAHDPHIDNIKRIHVTCSRERIVQLNHISIKSIARKVSSLFLPNRPGNESKDGHIMCSNKFDLQRNNALIFWSLNTRHISHAFFGNFTILAAKTDTMKREMWKETQRLKLFRGIFHVYILRWRQLKFWKIDTAKIWHTEKNTRIPWHFKS